MFSTENEMQEKLYSFLINRENRKDIKKYLHYREVDIGTRPDILAYSRNEMIAYELKLIQCEQVWRQAYNYKHSLDKVYVVLPQNEIERAKKFYKENENSYKGIGLMSFNGEKIKVHIGSNLKPLSSLIHTKMSLMDSIIKGLYLGGNRERKSY